MAQAPRVSTAAYLSCEASRNRPCMTSATHYPGVRVRAKIGLSSTFLERITFYSIFWLYKEDI